MDQVGSANKLNPETIVECLYEAKAGRAYRVDALEILVGEVRRSSVEGAEYSAALEAAACSARDEILRGPAEAEIDYLFQVLQRHPGFGTQWGLLVAELLVGNW